MTVKGFEWFSTGTASVIPLPTSSQATSQAITRPLSPTTTNQPQSNPNIGVIVGVCVGGGVLLIICFILAAVLIYRMNRKRSGKFDFEQAASRRGYVPTGNPNQAFEPASSERVGQSLALDQLQPGVLMILFFSS